MAGFVNAHNYVANFNTKSQQNHNIIIHVHIANKLAFLKTRYSRLYVINGKIRRLKRTDKKGNRSKREKKRMINKKKREKW